MRPPPSPYQPCPYDDAVIAAFRALFNGEASPDQQRRVLDYIVEVLADKDGLSYRGENTHDTAFAEGRRFVGLQIVKMLKLRNLTQPKENG